MEGASAVIHIAGVVNAPDAAGFEEGNVHGTLRVIEAAHDMGVARVVHVSSLAAREPELSIYGASKLRGEKLVRASGASIGRWCARLRSMARAIPKCSSCFVLRGAGWCRCRRVASSRSSMSPIWRSCCLRSFPAAKT